MKRIAALLTVLCLTACCGLFPAAAEEIRTEGDPWINSDIFGMWPSERPAPEEQYTLYVNFDFYREAPALGNSAGMTNCFTRTNDMIRKQQLELCTDPKYTDAESECMRILYGFYTDRETIGKDGFASLMGYADRIKAAGSLEDLTALMREEGLLFGSPFFYYGVSKAQDSDTEQYVLSINRSYALGSPMPEDEEKEAAVQKLVRMQYSEAEARQLVEKMFAMDNFFPAEYVKSEHEVELEEKLALTLAEIREVCPPLAAMLEGQGLMKEDAGTEAVYQAMFMDLIAFREFCTEENLDVLKAVICLSMYSAAETRLGHAAFPEVAENQDPYACFAFFPRDLVAKAYVRYFIPEERIADCYQLVEDLKEAMKARIEQSTWASPETKAKAYEKLDKMVMASMLDPVEYDFEALRTALRSCRSLMEAVIQETLFSRKCMMQYAGMEAFRGNRRMTNESAFGEGGKYYPWENAIYIAVSSLTGETWNEPSRENFLATIGTQIGHELSHGFDTYGMTYDAEGAQNPIGTEADMQTYMERANAVADRAGRIKLLDDLNVQGNQQITEIIADTEGFRLALDLAKKEESFDYDAFFRAYARYNNWYYSDRETYRRMFTIEVHPAPVFRVNFTVQLTDEFYETYPSVTEGTPMYLPPEERELVW